MQTQEGNGTSWPDAGKTSFPGWREVGGGVWPGPGRDPWESKATRWMGERGAGLVRAGILAWQDAGRRFSVPSLEGRRVGVIGVVAAPAWPDWLRGKGAGEVASGWKEQPPLWLLGSLPNVPVTQLAIEVGARGPVETIRWKPSARREGEERVRGWRERGVERVLWVEEEGGVARAWVWERAER